MKPEASLLGPVVPLLMDDTLNFAHYISPKRPKSWIDLEGPSCESWTPCTKLHRSERLVAMFAYVSAIPSEFGRSREEKLQRSRQFRLMEASPDLES